jgi:epoxyqueuosine reductase QueG
VEIRAELVARLDSAAARVAVVASEEAADLEAAEVEVVEAVASVVVVAVAKVDPKDDAAKWQAHSLATDAGVNRRFTVKLRSLCKIRL